MNDTALVAAGDSSADATTGVGGAVIGIAILFVALRFYTRFFTKAGYGWDDWLILLSVVATVLTGVLLLWATAVDPGGNWVSSNSDPNYHYTPENIFNLKLSFIASVLYFTIASSTKLSILLMYNRIFSTSDSFRLQIFVVAALVVGFWIGTTVATLTNCIPLKWSWLNSLSDARYCFNYNIFWAASGAVEAFIDVLIIVMPVRIVWKLQMDKRIKATIVGVFALGIFAVVTGLLKVILGYVPGSRVPNYIKTEVWTTVHVGTANVCACLPVCWPLFRRIFKVRLGSLGSYFPVRGKGSHTRTISSANTDPAIPLEGRRGSSRALVRDVSNESGRSKGQGWEVTALEEGSALAGLDGLAPAPPYDAHQYSHPYGPG